MMFFNMVSRKACQLYNVHGQFKRQSHIILDRAQKFTVVHLTSLNLLIAAKVEGCTTSGRIKNYEKALGISDKRYAVVIKRDIDETRVNLYNPEWIKCWNNNMDIQPCLDYFGIITCLLYTSPSPRDS